MLPLVYCFFFLPDVLVISPSGHVLLVGVFAMCLYTTIIFNLVLGCRIHVKTIVRSLVQF